MKPNHLTQNWSRKKKFLVKSFLFLTSLIIALTFTEISLRLINYSFPTFYSVDEFRGYALTPNIEGWYRKEGAAYIRINSDGLRDIEHSKTKPANTLRIAVVGDSYSEAFQVPLENAFWKLAENQLRQCSALGGRNVEIINFGVSGYGTAQELITLQQQVWDYSPDVVLLAFTTNNDITDNSRTLKKTDDIPYYVYHNDELKLDDSFHTTINYRWRQSFLSRAGTWLRDNLRFVQLIHQAQFSAKNYLAKRRAQQIEKTEENKNPDQQASPQTAENKDSAQRSLPQTEQRAKELGIDNLIYTEPVSPDWQEAWRVTEDLLRRMRDEIKDKNARFLIVTLSNGAQVLPNSEGRRAFMQRVGATDLFYPDQRIKNFGERENITVYNLAPELQIYAERNQVFLHGFGENIGNGHWNVEGHRAAGEKLSQKLCEEFFR